MTIEDFILPFEGKLKADNRWVKMAESPQKVFSAKDKKLARHDARDRILVEGAFGVTKRRYSLGLIMTRLQETSESVTAMQFLVMNLAHRLRFFCPIFKERYFFKRMAVFKIYCQDRDDFCFLLSRNTGLFSRP